MKVDLSALDQFKASSLAVDAPSAPVRNAPGEMDLDLIDFDEEQPRRGLREDALRELADSIAVHGVLEPVSLRPNPARPGRYIVNRGERRCRASRLADRRTVPCFIDTRLDRFAQAVENLQREDLSPFDLATFIAEREREGLRRAEIARRLHKPASFITEAAGLIAAPPEVRAVFDAGRARDTRVLYTLTRALREQPGAVAPLLAGSGAITREAIDSALASADGADDAPSAGEPAEGARPPKAVAPEQVPESATIATGPVRQKPGRRGTALLVEHAGRRGRMGWARPPDRQSGEVRFEDGTCAVVRLSELKILQWTGR